MQPGPGVLMPGMQSPGMPVGAWALGMAVPGAGVMAEQYHVQGGQNMQVPSDMNDRDVRMLKRKQVRLCRMRDEMQRRGRWGRVAGLLREGHGVPAQSESEARRSSVHLPFACLSFTAMTFWCAGQPRQRTPQQAEEEAGDCRLDPAQVAGGWLE